MDGSDYLLTTAELAVALAGFSALIVVLRQNDSRGIPAGLVSTLIERSLVATLLSLLPLLLSGLGVPAPQLWFVASGLLGTFIVSIAWRGATLRSRVPEAAEQISGPAFALMYVLGLVVMVLQFANALGVGVQQSVWWYLVGLTWLLASVCVLFFLSVRGWARAA